MKTAAALFAMLSLVCFTPLLHAQDDAKRAAPAEDVLKAMHFDEIIVKLLANQKEAMKKMLGSRLPKNLSPEVLKQVQDVVSASVDTMFQQLTWDSLKPDFVQAYSEVYTEQELKDLAKFYQTPLGRTLIEKMPELQSKTTEIMQKHITPLLPAFQSAVRDAVMKAQAAGAPAEPPAPPQQ